MTSGEINMDAAREGTSIKEHRLFHQETHLYGATGETRQSRIRIA